MTKEQKIENKQKASYRRKGKRIAKDEEYARIAWQNDVRRISWGRKRKQGRVGTCEMNYAGCYGHNCNGDC